MVWPSRTGKPEHGEQRRKGKCHSSTSRKRSARLLGASARRQASRFLSVAPPARPPFADQFSRHGGDAPPISSAEKWLAIAGGSFRWQRGNVFGCRWSGGKRTGLATTRGNGDSREIYFQSESPFSLAGGRQSGATAVPRGNRCSQWSGSPARLGQTTGPRSAVPANAGRAPQNKDKRVRRHKTKQTADSSHLFAKDVPGAGIAPVATRRRQKR